MFYLRLYLSICYLHLITLLTISRYLHLYYSIHYTIILLLTIILFSYLQYSTLLLQTIQLPSYSLLITSYYSLRYYYTLRFVTHLIITSTTNNSSLITYSYHCYYLPSLTHPHTITPYQPIYHLLLTITAYYLHSYLYYLLLTIIISTTITIYSIILYLIL